MLGDYMYSCWQLRRNQFFFSKKRAGTPFRAFYGKKALKIVLLISVINILRPVDFRLFSLLELEDQIGVWVVQFMREPRVLVMR